MLISVIIPTYKPDNYIFDCLDSLTKQTLSYDCFEIIIVLNGCKKPYQDFLNKYIHNKMLNMNVILLQCDKSGVSNARNIALRKAGGKYICFLDDDDFLSSNYLKDSLKMLQEDTIVVSKVAFFTNAIGDIKREHPITKNYNKFSHSECGSLFKMRSFLSNVCYKIIPHSIIGSTSFNTTFKMGEDSLFMFSISDKIKHIKFLDAVYYRRIRVGSATQTKRSRYFKLVNAIRLSYAYIKAFIKHPFQYNFLILSSRLVATFLHLIK